MTREAVTRSNADCLYLFAVTGEGVTARMFDAEMGIGEDPATGGAAGPLGAYLAEHGLAEAPGPVTIRQGEQVGRPELHVEVAREGDAWRVRVGGGVHGRARRVRRLRARRAPARVPRRNLGPLVGSGRARSRRRAPRADRRRPDLGRDPGPVGQPRLLRHADRAVGGPARPGRVPAARRAGGAGLGPRRRPRASGSS